MNILLFKFDKVKYILLLSYIQLLFCEIIDFLVIRKTVHVKFIH